jgi:hypothetical protein
VDAEKEPPEEDAEVERGGSDEKEPVERMVGEKLRRLARQNGKQVEP